MTTPPVRTIALFYGHVASNIGDLAINRGEIALLRRAFPAATITVVLLDATCSAHLARATASFGAIGGVIFRHIHSNADGAAAHALDPGGFLDACGVAETDLVVLAAGEHLFRYADGANDKSLFWRMLPAFAARARGLRCLLLPSTFGPFETPEATGLISAFFATGLRAAAREPRSAEGMAATVPGLALDTMLDPAFFLTPPVPAPREGPRTIGLVMRSEGWGIRLLREEQRAATAGFEADGYRSSRAGRFATAFADQVLAAGASLRLFIQTDADRALSEAVAARFAGTPEAARIEMDAPDSVEAYLAALAAVDGVAATRFHALVLGLVAERPVYGAHFSVHGHKMPGLFDLLGQPDLCADLSRSEPEAAARTAAARLLDPQAAMVPFAPRLDALRQQTMDWLQAEWPTRAAGELDLGLARPLGQAANALAKASFEAAATKSRATAEATMERLRAECETKTAELQKAKTGLAAAVQARAEAEATMESLRAEGEARAVAHARLQEAAQAARAEADLCARELEQSRKQGTARARQAATINEALARQLWDIETSESFRLGHAIVRTLTAPGRFIRGLPLARRRNDANVFLPDAGNRRSTPLPIPLQDLIGLHDTGGAPAIITALGEKLGQDPARLGPALLQTGRSLAQAGVVEAEYPLVTETVRLDPSAANLRALFWAAQRAGDLVTAWASLAEVERLYGPAPDAAQRKFIAKMRAGPIVNVALLDEIRTSAPRAFDPVPLRLCYVLHNSLPYSSGGYATRAQGLALGLTGAGFEVVCLTRPGFPRDTKPELAHAAVADEDVIDGIRYLRAHAPLRQSYTAIADYVPAAADAMEAQFRELRPGLVIAASAYLSALPALIAAKRLGLPFIYEVRGFWEITRISRNPALEQSAFFRVQKVLEAEIAKHADHVFTLTGPMRVELVARGVAAEKITLLPNSCDPERFTPRPRDAALAARLGIPLGVPVIGYIGTFVQYEGLDDLARACARLRARGLAFRLLLVGNENTSGAERGPIMTELARIAAEEGLGDWLIMPGRVPHTEVEAYYSLIDIAPFPRKPQPVTEMVSPMKPLEALAMEKAVVVSGVRALAEMIADGETGLVFQKGNIDSLAEVLARLIADPDLRTRLGRTARERVARDRTWTATAATARGQILRVLAESPASPVAPAPEAGPVPAAALPAAPVPARAVPAAVILAPAVPAAAEPQNHDRDEIFRTVQELYFARDRARGKVRFSDNDWQRTRIAFDILHGVPRVADVGIGQAQLVNLLARCPETLAVDGYDFRDYSTRIAPPETGRYAFRVWDITRPLDPAPTPVDVVVAMEVLEHIAVPILPAVFARLRALSSRGAMLITVPYREKQPLYHHYKPHGHQQSFDDAKIEMLFGPGCLYSNYQKKWYLVLVHDELIRPKSVTCSEFCAEAVALLQRSSKRQQLETVGAGDA